MVMIKMAPTDTTTLHIEYSHANHIMAEGLSVSRGSDKLDKIICPVELSVRSVSVSALKTHAPLSTPRPGFKRACLCV